MRGAGAPTLEQRLRIERGLDAFDAAVEGGHRRTTNRSKACGISNLWQIHGWRGADCVPLIFVSRLCAGGDRKLAACTYPTAEGTEQKRAIISRTTESFVTATRGADQRGSGTAVVVARRVR